MNPQELLLKSLSDRERGAWREGYDVPTSAYTNESIDLTSKSVEGTVTNQEAVNGYEVNH